MSCTPILNGFSNAAFYLWSHSVSQFFAISGCLGFRVFRASPRKHRRVIGRRRGWCIGTGSNLWGSFFAKISKFQEISETPGDTTLSFFSSFISIRDLKAQSDIFRKNISNCNSSGRFRFFDVVRLLNKFYLEKNGNRIFRGKKLHQKTLTVIFQLYEVRNMMIFPMGLGFFRWIPQKKPCFFFKFFFF